MTDSRLTYHGTGQEGVYEVRQDGEHIGFAFKCSSKLWCGRGADQLSASGGPYPTRHEAGLYCEQIGVSRYGRKPGHPSGKPLGQRMKERRERYASAG